MCYQSVKSIGRLLILIMSLAIVGAGCPSMEPPAEAVLAGTWKVETTPQEDDLTQLFLTFDQNGALQTVMYQVTDNAVITVPSPLGTTNVEGQEVTISSTFLGNSLSFDGTLNATNDVIEGNITITITVGGIVITIDNGEATLTKQ